VRSLLSSKLIRSIRRPSLAGHGLPERMRSTAFAFLGLTAAAGLALVAIFAQLSFPLLSPSPLPDGPEEPSSISKAMPVEPGSTVVGVAQAQGAVAAPGSARGQGGSGDARRDNRATGVDGPATPVSGSPAGESPAASEPVATQPPATVLEPAPVSSPTTTAEAAPAPVESPAASPGSKPDKSTAADSKPEKPEAKPAAVKPSKPEAKPAKTKPVRSTKTKPAKPAKPEAAPAPEAAYVPAPAPAPAETGKGKEKEEKDKKDK